MRERHDQGVAEKGISNMNDKVSQGGVDASGISYANELITEGAARRIHDELYGGDDYDAIWRLSNSGFVIRLEHTYILLDPILTSPLPTYEAIRAESVETGHLATYRVELRHHDRWENLFKEVHALPLPPEDVEKADYLLLTHEHVDHFDTDGLKRIAHLGPTVVAPKACHQKLVEVSGLPERSIIEARHRQIHEFETFSLRAMPASHKGAPGACGYLLQTRHGNIYHPGDGVFDQDHKELVCDLDVDYLLLPINDTNLGVGFAALLTHLLQPKAVIPCHYGYVYPAVRAGGGHPAEFVTALAARNYKIPNTDIMILNPGGKMVLV